MSTRFCPYCGSAYPNENARFCSKCGRSSEPAHREPQSARREPKSVRRPRKALSALFAILAFLTLTLLLLTQSVRLGLSESMVRRAVGRTDIGSLPIGGIIPGSPENMALGDSIEEIFNDLPGEVRLYYDLTSSALDDALSSKRVKEWFVTEILSYVDALLYNDGAGKINGRDIKALFNVIGREMKLPDLGDNYIEVYDDDEEALKIYYVENVFTEPELAVIRVLFSTWFNVLLGVLTVLFLFLALYFACGRILRGLIAPGLSLLISGLLVIITVIVSVFVLPGAVASISGDAGEAVGVAVKNLFGGIGLYGSLTGGASVVLGALFIILFVIAGKKKRSGS